MAALGMMIGGAIVNGIAFTGSSYLFKMFDKNAYQAEMKRHDLATEKLQKAKTEWEEHREELIDFVNLQLKKEHNAAVDFQNVDYALTLYNELHPTNKQILRKKPQLSDYYTPSGEMKNYEYLWIIGGLIGVGFIIKFVVY
jgi:hypothetical protein